MKSHFCSTVQHFWDVLLASHVYMFASFIRSVFPFLPAPSRARLHFCCWRGAIGTNSPAIPAWQFALTALSSALSQCDQWFAPAQLLEQAFFTIVVLTTPLPLSITVQPHNLLVIHPSTALITWPHLWHFCSRCSKNSWSQHKVARTAIKKTLQQLREALSLFHSRL